MDFSIRFKISNKNKIEWVQSLKNAFQSLLLGLVCAGTIYVGESNIVVHLDAQKCDFSLQELFLNLRRSTFKVQYSNLDATVVTQTVESFLKYNNTKCIIGFQEEYKLHNHNSISKNNAHCKHKLHSWMLHSGLDSIKLKISTDFHFTISLDRFLSSLLNHGNLEIFRHLLRSPGCFKSGISHTLGHIGSCLSSFWPTIGVIV